MAEAAVSMAVETLGNLVVQKASELRGVQDQVARLKGDLEMMKCILRDAAKKQAKEETVRKCISEVRELAFEAEDVIDTFALKVDEPRKRRGLLGRCLLFLETVHHLDQLAKKIGSIKVTLKEIDGRLLRYGIQSLNEGPMVSSNSMERRRRVSPWHKDKQVVGLEEHVETLLKEALLVEKEHLNVAAIVGMAGVGKSTLARKLYNHKDLGEKFECRAWVSASRDFRPKELLKELVLQLKPHETEHQSIESLSESTLECMLYEYLYDTRYFIVVDDVWGQDWQYIEKVFPDHRRGSRLLITSRTDNILSKSDANVHKLNCLNRNDSWQLFVTASKCPEELENIGKKIVEKCDGLPLAIIVMAGLLLKQGESVKAWKKVWKEMESHPEDSLTSVLELSYLDLPPNLKCCFLYLNFYREDAPIDARTLIQLWIAEGIIPKENGTMSMEEIAEGYLDELIKRNMVQTFKFFKDGQVKSCQIHNLLRDLSLKKAMEEINFYVLKNDNTRSQPLDKARHLVIYEGFKSLESPIPHLRSLSLHSSKYENDHIIPSFLDRLDGCIKVLELGGLGLTMVPKKISTLIGLKYLGLRNNQIKKLPKSLGHLNYLQSLNLSGNRKVNVPNFIWKLNSLRHLYMPRDIICKVPLKLDTLTNLQTLLHVSTKNIVVEHLAKMVGLRELKLELTTGVDVTKLLTLLAKLENLVSLGLSWRWEHVLSLDGVANLQHLTQLQIFGKLKELPESFPQKLSCLKLSYTKLTEDPMPTLGRLPYLSCLKLFLSSYVGEEMVIASNDFPSLKILGLLNLPKLRQLSIENGGLLKLEELKIINCRDLNIIPEQEEKRLKSNLRKLKISGTSTIACELEGVQVHPKNTQMPFFRM